MVQGMRQVHNSGCHDQRWLPFDREGFNFEHRYQCIFDERVDRDARSDQDHRISSQLLNVSKRHLVHHTDEPVDNTSVCQLLGRSGFYAHTVNTRVPVQISARVPSLNS